MSYSESVQLVPTTKIPSPIMKKSKVCRCLFGRPDRESGNEIRAELKRQMDEDLGVAKLRWGFDIEEDVPLSNGPYEWKELPASDVPSFYTDAKYTERRILKASRKPSRKLCRNLTFSEEDSTAPELCFSPLTAERLRAESKQNSESSSTDLSSDDLQAASIPPIREDITTPCVKQMNKLEVSNNDSKMDLTSSGVSSLTCAISKPKEDATTSASQSRSSASETTLKFSGETSQPVGDKPKKQSVIGDYLKVRKRKASYSLSSNRSAKNLRRL